MTRRKTTQVDMDRSAARIKALIKNPDAFPDDVVVVPMDTEIFHSIFSPERVRVLRFLRETGPVESVTELANLIDRDVSRVSRDLDVLEEANLVERRRVGKHKTVHAAPKTIWVV